MHVGDMGHLPRGVTLLRRDTSARVRDGHEISCRYGPAGEQASWGCGSRRSELETAQFDGPCRPCASTSTVVAWLASLNLWRSLTCAKQTRTGLAFNETSLS